MSSVSIKRLRFALISVSVVILIAVVFLSNPSRLFSIISKGDLRYIFFAFAVTNAAVFVRVAKWKVLLDNVRFFDLFPVQLLGITISSFSPGKIAEPAKAFILKAKIKANISETLRSIVWERILDIIVLIALALFALQAIAVSGNFLFLSALSLAVFMAIAAVLLMTLRMKGMAYRFFHLMKRLPLLKRIDNNFIEAFYSRRIRPKNIGLSLSLTAFAWVLDGFVFFFAFRAVGLEISPFLLAGLIALATLVGIISFLPGGLGSMELAMLFFLGGLGIDSSVALSGILLARFLSIWYVIFLGGLSFVYLSRKADLKAAVSS